VLLEASTEVNSTSWEPVISNYYKLETWSDVGSSSL